jgi:hypothetical protein
VNGSGGRIYSVLLGIDRNLTKPPAGFLVYFGEFRMETVFFLKVPAENSRNTASGIIDWVINVFIESCALL